MAGFLPLPENRGAPSSFRTTVQNTAQHLARLYGGTGIEVNWHAIGHELTVLGAAPNLARPLFDGEATRLGLSVERLLVGLGSGQVQAGAIITDLMATGDQAGVTGPIAVLNALGNWLQSDDVRSGHHHVGILGVRAKYWGVFHPTACPRGPPLGCWYNESLRRFERLETVALTPFYVLLIGADEDSVASLLASLVRGITAVDPSTEVQWELLTRRTLGARAAMDCHAHDGEDGPQYELYRTGERDYYSVNPDTPVTLSCALDGVRADSAVASWLDAPQATDITEGGDRSLLLEVVGTVDDRSDTSLVETWSQHLLEAETRNNSPDWTEWYTEVERLGRTLQLDGLLDGARLEPDDHRLELTLLRFRGS